MKGIQGLLLAIALGLAGAAFNWIYLTNKSREVETVKFVGIKADRDIQLGQVLRDSDIEAVPIPKPAVGNLEDFAVAWDAKQAALNMRVSRNLLGGSLLLREDLETPPQELKLADNERAVWVPVDTRAFVPSLVEPGDLVTFLITPFRSTFPTPAPPRGPAMTEQPPEGENPPTPAGQIEQIGPFEILALGNRLGSTDVLRADKKPQMQENVMAIRVTVDQQGNPGPDALKLMRLVSETNFRPVGVMLHPRKAVP